MQITVKASIEIKSLCKTLDAASGHEVYGLAPKIKVLTADDYEQRPDLIAIIRSNTQTDSTEISLHKLAYQQACKVRTDERHAFKKQRGEITPPTDFVPTPPKPFPYLDNVYKFEKM